MHPVTVSKTFAAAQNLHRAGQFREAEALYRQILEIQPQHIPALHYLGVLANEVGRHELAVGLISRALQVEPNNAAGHSNLGQAYQANGQLDEAITCFRRALVIHPHLPQAHANLGGALRSRKELKEAETSYRRALEIKPDYAEAWNNLGSVLRDQGRLEEAVSAYLHAAQAAPDYAEIQNNLGVALSDRGGFDEAIAAFRNAVRLNPDYAEAQNNLGATLAEQGRSDEAVTVLRHALEIRPDHSELHNSLGTVLQEQGRLDDALVEYQRATALQPEGSRAKLNLSLLLLRKGDFEQGWPLHEARWKAFPHLERPFHQPRWNGEALQGQRLLLHAEQGLGDTIQFVRYAPLLEAQGGTVILECQPGLKTLLQEVKGASQVLERGEPLPAFDVHCPMMSLPLVLGTQLDSIPATVPYLHADRNRVARWRERLENPTPNSGSQSFAPNGPLKIGLAWAGGIRPHQPNSLSIDRRRSMPLDEFGPLAGETGVVFVSLQKGPAGAQARTPPAGMSLLDWTDEQHDFAETAALIEALDLVISVDTAVAHLAGALGKPVWVLNRFDACWRWLLDREDSPWYPTMRLFRQPAHGDWDSVIQKVVVELRVCKIRLSPGDHTTPTLP